MLPKSLVWNATEFEFPSCSNIQDVDAQMDSIREQMDISNQISEAISSPHNLGIDIDEVRRNKESRLLQSVFLVY